MTFLWRLQPDDATGFGDVPSHSNQSDAESWLGENWRALAAAGVSEVTLVEDGDELYQMSLDPQ